ncbi:undecaprenyldiphospho-muramoylpentapeptide beta-N-acetylglucosaminyltransferase [Paraneptunicella aestuarii]|uniref:undecaprenyldiphospho-muramoylpentapeptide beta-N-acetylglucosaminyltransferase n=1 Tax=Paraneptunicella aestuarii TaxID=2831148 RepID=UPI001E553F68|nr:undecaprenyldiphospho-muramoylpentapeptide beta-N-acetylglucosaminyltransferase [Paraneptunicella aestuarii]UAA38088.1 undecaprenyldiphospho-muramoylpentapeptide beta-N-acetylglucosaminyltransferase [Paraneptunicella aestuarii]
MSKRLLVMAGGTGGHIFPGIAVARELQAQGWQIHWLGTPARMEAQLVPKAGFDISFIDVSGVRGNGVMRLLAAPFLIIKAIWQAIQVIRKFKPSVVLGMGGFASGPGGIAAWLMGVPVVIHEQNAVPGMTNRLLSHVAKRLLVGFDQSFQGNPKAKWVGNPVRNEFNAVPEKAVHGNDYNLLVVGGSLGAQCLNEQVPKALNALKALMQESNTKLVVQHQCGKGHVEAVTTAYRTKLGEAGEADSAQCQWDVTEFIDDMVSAYSWADIIICRAGALTVAEVAASGRCAIFVPLPHAVDDHQTLNARSLVDKEAALLLPQTELVSGGLTGMLRTLLSDPEKVVTIGSKARSLAKHDATQQVAQICAQVSLNVTGVAA